MLVLLRPVQQLVEVAALMYSIEVRMGMVMRNHPVGRDRAYVARAHNELSNNIDAVI